MCVRNLRLALVLGFALLTGCAVPKAPQTLYQLTLPTRSVPTKSSPTVVANIGVADYLNTDIFLQRISPSEVSESAARWVSPLAEALNEQLLLSLGQALNSNSLSSAALKNYDASVAIKLNRLDSGPAEAAVLEARWQLFDQQNTLLASRVLTLSEVHDGSLADQVRAQGKLLELLARQIAEHLDVALQAQVPAIEPVLTQPAPQPAERPKVKPARSVEVYRF